MNCDVMIKATLVDGIYSSDPKIDKNAIRYEKLSYMDVLSKDLQVIDASAVSLARENKIPLIISSIFENGNLVNILKGKGVYTIVN